MTKQELESLNELNYQMRALNLALQYDLPTQFTVDFVHFYTDIMTVAEVDEEAVVSKFFKFMLAAEITGEPIANLINKKMGRRQ